MKQRTQHHHTPRRPEHRRHHHEDEADFVFGFAHGHGPDFAHNFGPPHGRGPGTGGGREHNPSHQPHGGGPGHRGRGGRPGGGRPDGDGPEGMGGPGGRARRGESRFILLDALRDGPKHGYEIAKSLEERSGGRYVPSPGTVYPTLQYLEDMGFVRAEPQADRRVYALTDAGRAELDARADELAAFWKRFTAPEVSPANQIEVGFLQDEMQLLRRTVWGGLQTALEQGDRDTIRRVREAVEQCRNEVRRLIAPPENL